MFQCCVPPSRQRTLSIQLPTLLLLCYQTFYSANCVLLLTTSRGEERSTTSSKSTTTWWQIKLEKLFHSHANSLANLSPLLLFPALAEWVSRSPHNDGKSPFHCWLDARALTLLRESARLVYSCIMHNIHDGKLNFQNRSMISYAEWVQRVHEERSW